MPHPLPLHLPLHLPPPTTVHFFSQAVAEACIPDGTASIISITDRDAPPAKLNDGWHSVLRIQFNDVDPDEDGFDPDDDEIDLGTLTTAQADAIADHVLHTARGARTLVVHCRFGQSRSPGVAKALCLHFNLDFPADFRTQNRFVQRLVTEALARRAPAACPVRPAPD